MIKKIILFTIVLVVFQCSAQENEDFKLGLGLPIFTKNIKNVTISAAPTFTIEKPFPINIFSKNNFSINPGLAFFHFFEDERTEALGNGISTDLSHSTVNTYLKVFYNLNIKSLINSTVYLGGLSGFHLLTRSKGTINSYSSFYEQQNYSKNINESGKKFFNSIYYGFLLGFRPKSETTSVTSHLI